MRTAKNQKRNKRYRTIPERHRKMSTGNKGKQIKMKTFILLINDKKQLTDRHFMMIDEFLNELTINGAKQGFITECNYLPQDATFITIPNFSIGQ